MHSLDQPCHADYISGIRIARLSKIIIIIYQRGRRTEECDQIERFLEGLLSEEPLHVSPNRIPSKFQYEWARKLLMLLTK